MRSFYKWLHDNSLSIVFFCLFLVSIAGQSITGLHSYNSTLLAYGWPKIDFAHYLATGNFLDGVFSNWQAAILQLGCLIVFTSVFHQKGASHSLKLDRVSKQKRKKQEQKDRRLPWLYRHSLSVVFVLLFFGSFIAHLVFGTWSFNETNALIGHPPISIASYGCTATFWFTTAQTWQAEFVSIGIFLILTIFLRQQGSAESKPLDSRNDETGEVNQ